jgi:hypothetical protein
MARNADYIPVKMPTLKQMERMIFFEMMSDHMMMSLGAARPPHRFGDYSDEVPCVDIPEFDQAAELPFNPQADADKRETDRTAARSRLADDVDPTSR